MATRRRSSSVPAPAPASRRRYSLPTKIVFVHLINGANGICAFDKWCKWYLPEHGVPQAGQETGPAAEQVVQQGQQASALPAGVQCSVQCAVCSAVQCAVCSAVQCS